METALSPLRCDGGEVYLLQCSETGLIKIGRTAGPIAIRMSSVLAERRECAASLVLLGLIEGDVVVEKSWHKHFADIRTRAANFRLGSTEWFRPVKRLIDFVLALPDHPAIGLRVSMPAQLKVRATWSQHGLTLKAPTIWHTRQPGVSWSAPQPCNPFSRAGT